MRRDTLVFHKDWLLIISLLIELTSYFLALYFRNSLIRQVITFFGCTTICFIVLQSLKGRMKTHIIISLLLLVLIFLLNLLSDQSISLFNYLYTSYRYIVFFLVFSLDGDYGFTSKNIKLLRKFILLVIGIVIFLSFSKVAYIFEDGRTNEALVLGMTNSNLTGIILYLIFSLNILLNSEGKKNIINKMIDLFLLYLIWKTKSRTAFFASLFVFFVSITNLKKKTFYKNGINKAIVILCMLIPVLFVGMYLFAYQSTYFENLLKSFTLLSKPIFSGREITYMEYLNSIEKTQNLLFGNLLFNYFNNAHNGPLTIVSSIGLIGFIISYYSFGKQLLLENLRISTKIEYISLVIILSLYILSCSEGSIFMGAFPGIGFIVLIKGLSYIKE